MGCLLPAYWQAGGPDRGRGRQASAPSNGLSQQKWNVEIISKSIKIKTPIFHHSNILIFLRDEAITKEF